MVGVIPNRLVRGSWSSTMQVAVGLFHRARSQQLAQGVGVGIIRFVLSVQEVLSGPGHAQKHVFELYTFTFS